MNFLFTSMCQSTWHSNFNDALKTTIRQGLYSFSILVPWVVNCYFVTRFFFKNLAKKTRDFPFFSLLYQIKISRIECVYLFNEKIAALKLRYFF